MISNAILRDWLRDGDCPPDAMQGAADRWAALEDAFAELSTENDRLLAINADLYEALERIRFECDNDLSGRAKLFIGDVLAKARGEEPPR